MQSDSRPIGRKRNPIIEEARRRQIIDAAIETVAAVGYAQASLSRIAEHAQISKSVISYHFAGKDDLLEQVVTQIYDDMWAFIQARLETETTAAGMLSAYIRSNLGYLRSHRSRLLAVVDVVGNHRAPDGTPRFATTTDESVVTLLSEILRQGRHDGEFRHFDPQVVAVTVGQALIGAAGQWAADPTVDLAAYATELITLFDLATRK
ncbi:TetR/AcrR family transcriptional regulator [Rhizohabitans arisaemae]|uniref:TetR/AcrR family transcriptional regulator n=1 Tax=Rhizohabitans arisaemae TaxID=2720610 RepID=UPI0024B263A7|nr:TetR/AcrR family transcriptional regulator [Rhizohabitans arisaemae]